MSEAVPMDDILVINGFLEHVGDWRLGGMCTNAGLLTEERECEENNDAASCKVSDLDTALVVFVYSFGAATAWDETGGWHQAPGEAKKLLVCVADVTDWSKGQFQFSAPSTCVRSYCVYATNAIPATTPFPGVPTFDLMDPDLHGKLARTPVANVCADKLFSPPPFFADIPARVKIHTTIQNTPEVLDLCMWMAETFG